MYIIYKYKNMPILRLHIFLSCFWLMHLGFQSASINYVNAPLQIVRCKDYGNMIKRDERFVRQWAPYICPYLFIKGILISSFLLCGVFFIGQHVFQSPSQNQFFKKTCSYPNKEVTTLSSMLLLYALYAL